MARMWNSRHEGNQPRRGDKRHGLRTSSHPDPANQLHQESGGPAWPPFLTTPLRAGIAMILLPLVITFFAARG